MQMKEKRCLSGLLLEMNHECITTSPDRSVLRHNGNIPVHLQLKSSKFKIMPSAGKVMLSVFWGSQRVLLAHFQKHGENVNSGSYCVVQLKLQDAIRRKSTGQLARGVLLHHYNARSHAARETQERIQELMWELLEHPSL
jgi:hypothetical protein